MSSAGVPAFDRVGGNLDGSDPQRIDQTDSQARISATIQDLACKPFRMGVGESLHPDGVYPLPPTTMFSHPPSDTIPQADWTTTYGIRPPRDAVPSAPVLPRNVGDREAVEPSARLPPSKTTNARNPKKRTRTPTKSKTKCSRDSVQELLVPQPGPVQVCISNPRSVHERSMTMSVLGDPFTLA